MDLVRLCPVCEHINTPADAARCRSCWAFLTDTTPIARSEAERRVNRVRIPVWRRRYLIIALALILAVVAWRAVVMFDVIPLLFPPPGPQTDASADVQPGAWAQVRRTANSTGYTPEEAPVPLRSGPQATPPAPRSADDLRFQWKVLWTFDANEPLTNTVSVAGHQVFLSTEGGRTLSLDRETGKVLWEHRSPFPSSTTPAVTGDLAVTALRPGKVVALDRASGNVRWDTDLGEPLFSSPVIADGRVYIGATDRNLHGLDAATGEKGWKFTSDDWVNAPPSYDGDILAMSSRSTRVELVDTRTARRKLIYDVAGVRRVSGGPAIQGDLVYFGTQDGTVWAIDRNATTYPLERAIQFIRVNLYIWGLGPLPVQKGTVWTHSIDGEMTHAPVVGPKAVFAATDDGTIAAMDAATGRELWVSALGAEIMSGLSVAGNTVLAGMSDGRVLGLDAATGVFLWEFATGGPVSATPIVAGGVMYAASQDGKLYAVVGE